jgi:hypothetical protein
MDRPTIRPTILDSIEQLTPRWYTGALREGGVIDGAAIVVAADTRLFGTGQLGLVARSELRYQPDQPGGPRSLIVKLPSADERSRGLGVAMGAYQAEVRFYQQILPEVEVRTPRHYWSDVETDTGRYTLLLEDLSGDWEPGDVMRGATLNHAHAAIEQLVNLQAPVWDSPALRAQTWLADIARTQMLFDYVPPALEPFRARFGARLAPEHLELARRLFPRAAGYPRRAWTGPLTLMHGDFRLDNLLFREHDGHRQACVLDWQSVRLGPPLVDLAMYLGSALDTGIRRAHEYDLLKTYHDRLVAAGVEGFSFADCQHSYRWASLYSFLLGAGMSVTIAQTERGDQMFAALIAATADLVQDNKAAELLDG